MTRRSLFSTPGRRAAWIFSVALALRILFFLQVSGTACLAINLDPISDMETFHRWGLTLASGDWLDRSGFHPFHPWQSAIATEGDWNHWYGKTYHQEPLYPYLIAVVYSVLPGVPLSIIILQHLGGALGCAFVYLAAFRMTGARPALWAGLLSAVYGPYLFYESLLLRDTFLIFIHSVMLWTIAEAWSRLDDEKGMNRAWIWWCAAGGLAGVSCITKASILPFVILFAGLVASRRKARGFHMREAGIFCAGFVLVLMPILVRNMVVGADLLKSTTRGPVEFINGNNPWHMGTGWFDGNDERVSNYAHGVLARADGRLLPTVGMVLGDWSDDPVGYFSLQMRKLGYFFAPFEMPNNASYSYFRTRVSLLRLLPSFFIVSPLIVIGLVASWTDRGRFLPAYLFVFSGIAVTVFFYVIARFRIPFMPPFMIFAGLGLGSVVDSLRDRQFKALAVSGVIFGSILTMNLMNNYPDWQLVRPQDFIISIQDFEKRGRKPDALREANEGREVFPDFALFHRKAGYLNRDLGRREDAIAAFETALDLEPDNLEILRELAQLSQSPGS